MKKLLIPLILLLVGVGGGVGAGLFLVPPAKPDAIASAPCGELETDHIASDSDGDPHDDNHTVDVSAFEYAKLNNQFIVPVVKDGSVKALVVLALSVEVTTGQKDAVFLAEPRLRDSFLQAMFDHANIGGFDGNFTSATTMRPLREELSRRGKKILPKIINDVLIVDIVRQDS